MNINLDEIKALRAETEKAYTSILTFLDDQIEYLTPLDIANHIAAQFKDFSENIFKTDAIFSLMKKHGNIKPITSKDADYASISMKQATVRIILSGLEKLQNKEQLIELLDARIGVAKHTLLNLMVKALYSRSGKDDKTMDGLLEAVPNNLELFSEVKLVSFFEGAVAAVKKAGGECDLIVVGPNVYMAYMKQLAKDERFGDKDTEDRGFANVMFMGIPVVMQSDYAGIDTNHAYFLSTKHLELRPFKERNFTTLNLGHVLAETHAIVWAGNFVSTKPCHRLLEMKVTV